MTWTVAKADEAARADEKRARAKYPMTPCNRCGGEGYVRGQSHVERGVCFKCRGTGQIVATSEARAALARELAGIELTRLRRCWQATREELQAVRREADRRGSTWETRAEIAQLERRLASYETAGKEAKKRAGGGRT